MLLSLALQLHNARLVLLSTDHYVFFVEFNDLLRQCPVQENNLGRRRG
jgi:hypothetical protein